MCSLKPWKLSGIFRLMAVVLACASSLAFTDKHKTQGDSFFNLVVNSLSLHGSILIGTGIVLWSWGKTWRETFGFSKPPVARAVLLGLAAALLFLPVGMLLQDLSIRALTWCHVAPETQTAVEEFDKATSPASRIYLAVFAVTLAPVAEEVLFRGVFFALVKRMGFPRLALWSSALLFSAIHENLPIFAPLFVLGLVLAWLYERTGNLLASISAHAFFNAINLVLLVYGDRLEDFLNSHFHYRWMNLN